MNLSEVIAKYNEGRGELKYEQLKEWVDNTELTKAEKTALFVDYGCINRFDFSDDPADKVLARQFTIARLFHDKEKHPVRDEQRWSCYHTYRCQSCGFCYSVDSSD